MKLIITALSIYLFILACNYPQPQKSYSTNMKLNNRFQQIIDSIYHKYPSTKGISMHIEAPELDISWTGAVGIADTNRKLKANDPALIASNTKTYITAAILRLVELGKIDLETPIASLISKNSNQALIAGGYNTDSILVKHLNSHTSGINDYTNTKTYLTRTIEQPNYKWTRQEQIELTTNELKPIGKPGDVFSYSDANNLLQGEIIERFTGKPFYEGIRQLLKFEQLGIKHTWFNTLESYPKDLSQLVHQYASNYKVDSYTLHPSFDLFGGGGLAATPKDVAQFTQYLFNGQCFDTPSAASMLYTEVPTKDGVSSEYYMGIIKTNYGRFEGYGHGGFWGTTAQHFPSLNASVAVFLMERDQWEKYKIILELVAEELDKERKSLK